MAIKKPPTEVISIFIGINLEEDMGDDFRSGLIFNLQVNSFSV